ncbi:MAG TPA: ABC transporter permease [Acidobacteriota bacterium]|nr:ABC transporter permease [Acidobacteriota bacterium]
MKIGMFEMREALLMALDSVRTNKMRSLLTILGVMIGVSSVIGMVSLITGLNNSMARQIQSLGSNVIYVSKYKPGIVIGHRSSDERNRKGITYDDAMAVLEHCSLIDAVSPENHYWMRPSGNMATYEGNKAMRPDVTGILPSYQDVNNTEMAEGRFFTDIDNHFRRMVCVLGLDVSEALFPGLDPVGKAIMVNNRRFQVLGVVAPRESFLGESLNNFVLIPYNTFAKLYPWEKELWLQCRTSDATQIPAAIDQVTELMRRRRGVPYDKPEDFAVFTQESLYEQYKNITGIIYVAMTVISSIGLMVGGVGVMNIMLVSVTERTKEIGIRKAVGARRRNIVWQFLIEAMTLSGLGGVIGVLAGLGIAAIVNVASPLPAAVSIPWVIIAFTVAVGVGLIFGIYPAYRAARVDPIISLHYE